MSRKAMKVISVLMALIMVMGCASTAFAGADTKLVSNPRTEEVGEVAPFRLSVTVNGDPSTQKGICWYTKTETKSLVTVDGANVESIKIDYDDVYEWEENYCHKALVSGLTPGESYTYTVSNGAEVLDESNSLSGSFKTDDDDSTVKFIDIADVQAGNRNNMWKGANTLLAALETMPDADFIGNMGDFTNDSDNEEWDFYDEFFRDINANTTMAPVSGNHDGFARANWFNNMFKLDTSESVTTKNGVNYSFDYGNAHFAVLNTNDVLSISLSQLIWLKNDMNSTDKDWKIVFMHKTPYTFGKDGKWPDALYLQRSLTAVCDLCGVDLVMSGHDHQYLRTKPLKAGMVNENGTTYVLSGTAGTKRYEIRSFLAGLFMNKNTIAALNIQKDGYGNYWDGESWDNTRESNIGGCFNTVEIEGGKLTLNSYILSDNIYKNEEGKNVDLEERTEYNFDSYAEYITLADTYVIEKETGKNKATFTGDNTTSEAEYILGVVPSFMCLATYTFGEWLPKFLINLPNLLYVYITEDTF